MEKLEFKGTKGEWAIKTYEYIKGEIFIMVSDIPIVRIAINNYKIKKEAEANAKLIAAAPDLLEFAQEMVRRYPNSPWLYEQAQKAIEKALK